MYEKLTEDAINSKYSKETDVKVHKFVLNERVHSDGRKIGATHKISASAAGVITYPENHFRNLGYNFSVVIHPSSIISDNVFLSEGVQIMAGTIIQNNTKIGTDSIINTGAVIDHDCIIGNDCHIAPNSTICGSVKCGNESYIGAGATIIQKISIGKNLPKNLLNLDNSVKKNIELLSEAKSKKIENITACILNRPRHEKIIKDLRSLNVKIKFITDGDVSGAISVADPDSNIDIYLGIGGGPEGVLAAAALSCLGGQIQTRLVMDDSQAQRAKKLGISDISKKYNIDDMIKGDVIFSASAITDGDIVSGVKDLGDRYEVSSFALHKDLNISKKIKNYYPK